MIVCSNCKTPAPEGHTEHWRRVTVKFEAIPPHAGREKVVEDHLCPLCAADADRALEGRPLDDATH